MCCNYPPVMMLRVEGVCLLSTVCLSYCDRTPTQTDQGQLIELVRSREVDTETGNININIIQIF